MRFDEPSNTMPVIDSILQLPQVKASLCTRFFVKEELIEYYDVQHQHSLQSEVICDWLHLQVHHPSLQYYRTLEIVTLVHLESVEQLIETLKIVSPNILFFHSLLSAIRVGV